MKNIYIHTMLMLSLSGITESVLSQKVNVIEMVSAFENPTGIVLSDFVKTIAYIPLETTYDCLVDKNPRVYVTKDYIITITTYRCLIFSRKNGEFIREINHSGRGPNEYQSTKGLFNEFSSSLYFTGWNGNFLKYSLTDDYLGKIVIPGYKDSFDSSTFPMNYSFINDSVLVCDFLISTGTEPDLLMIFNEKNKIIMNMPNYNLLKNKQKFVLRTGESSFYHYNNNLFFHNLYNDTVFQVSDKKISPSYILDCGKFRPPFEAKWWSNDKWMQSRFIIQPIYFESNRFLALNFYSNKIKYFALYDKSSKSVKVTENNSGLKNDVDNLINITFDSMNLNGELIGIIQANEFIRWKDLNPGRINPNELNLSLLNKVELEDNPIIVIAKFK